MAIYIYAYANPPTSCLLLQIATSCQLLTPIVIELLKTSPNKLHQRILHTSVSVVGPKDATHGLPTSNLQPVLNPSWSRSYSTERHPRRHRQGDRGPPPQDLRQRAGWSLGHHPGKHHHRQRLSNSSRRPGPQTCQPLHRRCRLSCEGHGASRRCPRLARPGQGHGCWLCARERQRQ